MGESDNGEGASVREQPRPDANNDRYVIQLESENVYLRAQNDKKDQQLERRIRRVYSAVVDDCRPGESVLRFLLRHRIPG